MKAILACYSILFLFAACGTGSDTGTSGIDNKDTVSNIMQAVTLSDRQRLNAGVEVGTPRYITINSTIALQGMVDLPPQNSIALSFPLGGYIKSTSALPGKPVKKGDVLAVISDMQFIQLQQDYLTAKTNLSFLEVELERQRVLNASKASSDKVFQQAKVDVERQIILSSALGEKLRMVGIDPHSLSPDNVRRDLPVTSPVNGFISRVNVHTGQYTSPTDVLFELIDPADIHLSLKVFEKDADKISVGQEVSAFSNSEPDRRFNAKIFLINRTFDENNAIEIHCHFEKREPSLIPGMFMNADLTISDVRALVVPEGAVVRWANEHYVFTEGAVGQFSMIKVVPGISKDGDVQIEGAGISEGTRLVVKNAFTLLMKIKNTEEEG